MFKIFENLWFSLTILRFLQNFFRQLKQIIFQGYSCFRNPFSSPIFWVPWTQRPAKRKLIYFSRLFASSARLSVREFSEKCCIVFPPTPQSLARQSRKEKLLKHNFILNIISLPFHLFSEGSGGVSFISSLPSLSSSKLRNICNNQRQIGG